MFNELTKRVWQKVSYLLIVGSVFLIAFPFATVKYRVSMHFTVEPGQLKLLLTCAVAFFYSTGLLWRRSTVAFVHFSVMSIFSENSSLHFLNKRCSNTTRAKACISVWNLLTGVRSTLHINDSSWKSEWKVLDGKIAFCLPGVNPRPSGICVSWTIGHGWYTPQRRRGQRQNL